METFEDKIKFANERGLNGLMMWAIDLDDSKSSALSALTGRGSYGFGDNVHLSIRAPSNEPGYSSDDSLQCRVTECGGSCSSNETPVGRSRTDFGKGECKGSARNARYVCCPAWTGLNEDKCYWDSGWGAVSTDCSGKCRVGDVRLFGDRYGWQGSMKDGKYGNHCIRGHKSFCCEPGNRDQYMNICTWTECGRDPKCPDDKPHKFTTDTGGPRGNQRCLFWDTDIGHISEHRKLCCPKEDSFTNCHWRRGGYCSEQCSNGQVTLDLDPAGGGLGATCHNGRS